MIPSRMKAVILKGHGGFEQLEYRDDFPVPALSGSEVLIRVRAAAVNNTDINTRIGWYSQDTDSSAPRSGPGPDMSDGAWNGERLAFPRIQGADACGEIVAVGNLVDPKRIGERVLVDPMIRREGKAFGCFGSECDGSFAEYAKLPADNVHAISSHLSDVELASFPCSYATAENVLARARLAAGERVLITGASGGVGSALVQLALRRKAEVVAIAGDAAGGKDKAEVIRALGAQRVLSRDASLSAELGAHTVDLVIDVAGGPNFPQLLSVLRNGGRYAVVGAIAGAFVDLDLRRLYINDLTLMGCTQQEPEIFRDLVRYIERNEIRPLVSTVYPLQAIVQAQQEFLRKEHVGKIVLSL